METPTSSFEEDERGRYSDAEVAGMAQIGIRVVRPNAAGIMACSSCPDDAAHFRALDEQRAAITERVKNLPDVF